MTSLLRTIWQRYASEIAERVRALELAATELGNGALSPAVRDDARRAAHMLAGSVGTFGFAYASEAARSLETELAADCPRGPAFVTERVGWLRAELLPRGEEL